MKVFSAKTCTNVKSAVRSMEIEASDRERAAKLTKIKFCETEKVKNWPLLRIAFTLRRPSFRLRNPVRAPV